VSEEITIRPATPDDADAMVPSGKFPKLTEVLLLPDRYVVNPAETGPEADDQPGDGPHRLSA
jgi:hypothetical protein